MNTPESAEINGIYKQSRVLSNMFARRVETGGTTFNLYIMRYKTLDSVVNEGSYYQPSKAVMTLVPFRHTEA